MGSGLTKIDCTSLSFKFLIYEKEAEIKHLAVLLSMKALIYTVLITVWNNVFICYILFEVLKLI